MHLECTWCGWPHHEYLKLALAVQRFTVGRRLERIRWVLYSGCAPCDVRILVASQVGTLLRYLPPVL